MVKRIVTLIGLAALVCLAAALTSGCGMPVTQQGIRHELGPVHGRLDALDKKVAALEESTTANFAVANQNFQTLAAGVEQATKRAEAAKSLGETTVKLLGPIGRNAAVASKEATAGRKAAEATGQKVAEAQKAIGDKIEASTSITGAALGDVGQKVDQRADEVVGGIRSVDAKVDATKTVAETAVSRAGAARDAAVDAKAEAELAKAEAQIAGGKADAAGAKAEAAGAKTEAAVAKTGADTVVEVGKARKELSDHAVEAEKARQELRLLFGTLAPPPPSLPATSPAPAAPATGTP